MNYLQKLMNAEREFSALQKKKKAQSQNMMLCSEQRSRLFYESLKCLAERNDYKREIDELAEINFPIELKREINQILCYPKA